MCYLYTVVRQFLVQASNIIHTRNEADIIILYVFLIKIHAPRLVHAWCVCVCCMLYWIDNILVLIFANARARASMYLVRWARHNTWEYGVATFHLIIQPSQKIRYIIYFEMNSISDIIHAAAGPKQHTRIASSNERQNCSPIYTRNTLCSCTAAHTNTPLYTTHTQHTAHMYFTVYMNSNLFLEWIRE